MMSYNSLANYYSLTFQLMQHHKYSMSDLEQMLPFERDIYTEMLIAHLEDERQRAQQKK